MYDTLISGWLLIVIEDGPLKATASCVLRVNGWKPQFTKLPISHIYIYAKSVPKPQAIGLKKHIV